MIYSFTENYGDVYVVIFDDSIRLNISTKLDLKNVTNIKVRSPISVLSHPLPGQVSAL